MKRSFVRLMSGLLVIAMLMAMPVSSMASEWITDSSVATYSATEVNPLCNHNYDEGNTDLKVTVVAPTCEKGGYTQFECKICGQKYKGNYTAMLGHYYEFTETKNNKDYYKCSTCGKSYSVEQDEAGLSTHDHSGFDGATTTAHRHSATCKENDYGFTYYDCSLCGYYQYDPDAYEAPLAHNFGEWQFTKESSQSGSGTATRTCKDCGFVEKVKTLRDTPSAKSGRIKTDFVPAYETSTSSEVVLYLAKGTTFEYANVMYGSRYEVTLFDDVYGDSKSGTYYVESKNVELDPSSTPIYTGFKGVQEVVTVKTDGRVTVYSGSSTDSAALSTLYSGSQVYIYRYEAGGSWGRIDASANKWIQLKDSELNRVTAFGFGSQLSGLDEADPEDPEVEDVGTVTASSSTIVRNESNVSVGKLSKGTKINFYKSTDTDKPFEKDANGVITRGYIDEDEARRLGLSGAGYIDMTYVTLASGKKTSASNSSSSSSGSSNGGVIATGTVTSTVNLNVRKEPKVSVLNLMGSLPTGTKLEFYEIGSHNGAQWGRIKYNGKDGWVCMTYVQLTSGSSSSGSTSTGAKANGTVANCSVGVNVRDTTSAQGKLLGTIAVNSRVAVTKLENGWGFVDGKGWVYMQYVKLDAGAEEAIKNGSNSSNNNSSNNNNNSTIQTYTNVTVLGRVSGDEATIYPNTVKKPGSEQLTMVKGREFTITDRTIVNGITWFKTTVGGYTGWVADEGITLPEVVGTVNVAKLNVYSQPSTDSSVSSTLVQNAQVTIAKDGQSTDGIYVWGKIKNTNTYVQMNNLKLVIQASSEKGTSVGTTPITGKALKRLSVYKQPRDGATVLYEIEKNHAVSIDTWYDDGAKVWAKITVGEESGWVELNTDNISQNTVSATVNVDKLDLYDAAGDLNSRSGFTKRKNDKVTVLERTLIGTTVWGRVAVADKDGENDYWMNLAGTTLGTYSVEPTATTAPATTPTNSGTANGGTTTTTSVKGTICNTDSVNVRSGAGVSNPVATTLTRGTTVTVYEQKTVDNALWGRIDQGWVAMSYVDLSSKTTTGTTTGNTSISGGTLSGNTILTSVPSDAIAVGFVNTKNLNVRNGSGFGYTTTATLAQYTNVVVYEQILKDGVIWARIDQGWVCATYLTYTGLSVNGTGTAGTVARCFYTARLRANPGVNSALVGYVMVNSRLEVYEQQSYSGEMWGRTSIGWISMQYVLTDGSLPA